MSGLRGVVSKLCQCAFLISRPLTNLSLQDGGLIVMLMKGVPEVIESLNAGLTIELTAVNQYFIHSKMCESWGLQTGQALLRGINRRDETCGGSHRPYSLP